MRLEMLVGMLNETLNGHHRSLFKRFIWKETWTLTIEDFVEHSDEHFESHLPWNGLYVTGHMWNICPSATTVCDMWYIAFVTHMNLWVIFMVRDSDLMQLFADDMRGDARISHLPMWCVIFLSCVVWRMKFVTVIRHMIYEIRDWDISVMWNMEFVAHVYRLWLRSCAHRYNVCSYPYRIHLPLRSVICLVRDIYIYTLVRDIYIYTSKIRESATAKWDMFSSLHIYIYISSWHIYIYIENSSICHCEVWYV